MNNNTEEKVKPFRLVKYFTFISLIVMFAGTVVISSLNTHSARNMLLKKSKDYAHVLVENLNHQIFMQFFIPVALKFGKIQLRDEEQFSHMDRVVKNTLHSFRVETVNIYDMNNVISYSFEKSVVGKQNMGGSDYQNAVKGRSTSKLIQSGNFWEISFGFPKQSLLITFDPLRAEKSLAQMTGPILGVVEIVQDLSDDYKSIFNLQIRVLETCAIVMGILFIFLIFVVKRGEDILERRSLERLKLKEELNRAQRLAALGEMVAGVSHEIRNPLGIIRSSAEHLKKKMLILDPSNTIPHIIVEEATRLNNIITDFLNFAKPKEPELIQCRIEEILDKNISFFSTQIDGKHYEIERNYDGSIPEIMGDVNMLYQAFLNILLNAKEAMPGGGKIRVSANYLSQENKVKVVFEDEGHGLPDEIADKLWDPFFTTKEMGTGLGLGIVKNIIDAHGGSISIENKSSRGAQAVIYFPVKNK
ncbi:MAG: two-component sensor histidine kinase [Desulfobacterales bacterium]|nr:two-component sensor histidine kinase [Desulfobacterales bacterium]MBF0395420.1 two-component sensor histidine kinase [Desulfobacterales bacterium]